jgi:hypothetical protein
MSQHRDKSYTSSDTPTDQKDTHSAILTSSFTYDSAEEMGEAFADDSLGCKYLLHAFPIQLLMSFIEKVAMLEAPTMV